MIVYISFLWSVSRPITNDLIKEKVGEDADLAQGLIPNP